MSRLLSILVGALMLGSIQQYNVESTLAISSSGDHDEQHVLSGVIRHPSRMFFREQSINSRITSNRPLRLMHTRCPCGGRHQ